MNADLDDVGGKLRLTVFHNDLATPIADFGDNDIIDAFSWQPLPPLDSTFNVVRGLYTDPSNEALYQQVDYPEQRETSPDGIDRIDTFNLPMVQSPGQAQRLAQLRLQRQKFAGEFRAEFQANAWKVTKNSVIRLTFGQTGFVSKFFRVAEMDIRQDGVVPLVLREEDPAIYGDPPLTGAITPVFSTPFDPARSPFVQAINRWQGEYSPSATYVLDDLVTASNGAAWRYINGTPAAGQPLPTPPATSNAYWELFTPVPDNVAPANANRVPLSRMEGGAGWAVFREGSTGGAAFPALISGRSFILADPVFSASGQNHYLFNDPPISVIPGERLSVGSALEIFPFTGPTSAAWQLYVVFLDASGAAVSSVDVAAGVGNSPFSLTERVSGFVTVPANGVRAALNLRVQSAGAGQMRMGFLEPMVTSAAPGQTVHPPFSPGPVLTGPVDAGGPLLIGQLPTDKAVADLRNTTVTLAGLRSARPVSGAFIGQRYNATDTREAFRWDGFNWQAEADVTTTVSGPADIVMQFRADLALLSPLPLTADYQLGVAGAAPLTSGVSWSVSVVSGSFTGTAPSIVGSGTGQLRINSPLASPEATLRITASVAGRASPPFVVRVARNVAAPSLAPLTSINSDSFAQAHEALIPLTLPSGVTTANLSASADLLVENVLPLGITFVEGKWQRQISPGVFEDVGAVAAASPNPEVQDAGFTDGFGNPIYAASPGSISCNRTASGLVAGSDQLFRFVARGSGGNVRTVTFVGNASATA